MSNVDGFILRIGVLEKRNTELELALRTCSRAIADADFMYRELERIWAALDNAAYAAPDKKQLDVLEARRMVREAVNFVDAERRKAERST